jgi:rSAM/selenodomain-associated transferase 2
MLSKDRPVLSIVIPTLNEGDNIKATIDALKKSTITCPYDVVVVDGGSKDATIDEARQRGAQVIKCEPGRGKQLAAGGKHAKGTWLLFLHADTELETGWFQEVEQFITNNTELSHVGVFSYKLDNDTPAAGVLEAIVNWRTCTLALPYGDQGLLISNVFYRDLHGYAPIAIMEDVEIVRRIGRNRLHIFKSHAITSSYKYRRDGYISRPLKNFLCLVLYFLGFQPQLIAKIYR